MCSSIREENINRGCREMDRFTGCDVVSPIRECVEVPYWVFSLMCLLLSCSHKIAGSGDEMVVE